MISPVGGKGNFLSPGVPLKGTPMGYPDFSPGNPKRVPLWGSPGIHRKLWKPSEYVDSAFHTCVNDRPSWAFLLSFRGVLFFIFHPPTVDGHRLPLWDFTKSLDEGYFDKGNEGCCSGEKHARVWLSIKTAGDPV
jgi:hypothetical protein